MIGLTKPTGGLVNQPKRVDSDLGYYEGQIINKQNKRN